MSEFFDGLSDPLALALLGLLIAAVWAFWVRKRLLGGLLSVLFLWLYFLGITPGADLLLRPLEDAHPALIMPPSREVAAVVVLTGGEAASPGRPVTSDLSESSLERLIEGIRVWRMLGKSVPLIFVGGAGIPGRGAESPLMAAAAMALGVPEEVISWESTSRNTYENALAVRDILGRRPFVLVTSAFHMPRAVEIFRKLGTTPIPAPCGQRTLRAYIPYDFIPRAINLWHAAHALREYLAILWYRLRYSQGIASDKGL